MTKLINRIKKKLSENKNKYSEKELGDKKIRITIYSNIKPPSNEVVELAKRFKILSINDIKIDENNIINPNILIKNDDIYIRFEKFILDNSEGEKLPSQYDIETSLGITEYERKRLIKKGQENGLILKKNKTTNILNVNYDEVENEQFN